MITNIPDYEPAMNKAVFEFRGKRNREASDQEARGVQDTGTRGAVTGGQNRDAIEVMRWLLIGAFALQVGACSVNITNTGDTRSELRKSKSLQEIIQESKRQELELLKNNEADVDANLKAYAQRHFSLADETATKKLRLYKKRLESRPNHDLTSFLLEDYHEDREFLLNASLSAPLTLTVVESNVAAVAFPTGRVVINKALVESFFSSESEISNAFLGVLIHEIAHVRYAHSLKQWIAADGANALLTAKLIRGVTMASKLLPAFTIDYQFSEWPSYRNAEKLLSLSEFAADLITVRMLEEDGHAYRDYVEYLAHMNSSNSGDESSTSLLGKRISCLNLFVDAVGIDRTLSRIVIAPKSEHYNPTIRFDIDGMRLRYSEIQKQLEAQVLENVGDPSTQEKLKSEQESLKLSIRAVHFLACACQKTFSISPQGGVLTVPNIDLIMFGI